MVTFDNAFDNVEVYVRIADYDFEGQSLRFATVNEKQALEFSDEFLASVEQLHVYVGGEEKERYQRRDGKWVNMRTGIEYGVTIVKEKE